MVSCYDWMKHRLYRAFIVITTELLRRRSKTRYNRVL